jgi:hypothetical protein
MLTASTSPTCSSDDSINHDDEDEEDKGGNAEGNTTVELTGLGRVSDDMAVAIQALGIGTASRVPFERNVAWLHSVMTSAGGVSAAAEYVETISQHNATVLLPYSEQLVWWKAAALDVYIVYVGVVTCLWLVTKTCLGAIWILWRNLAQADLTKLD